MTSLASEVRLTIGGWRVQPRLVRVASVVLVVGRLGTGGQGVATLGVLSVGDRSGVH